MSKHRQTTQFKEYKEYVESGITVSLPSKQHFRFEDLGTYKSLSGQGLKEMDFCWLETNKVRNYTERTVFLLEIWSDPTADPTLDRLRLFNIDEVMVLYANDRDTIKKLELQKYLPAKGS